MNSVSLNNNSGTMKAQIESNQSEVFKRKLESAKTTKDDKELKDAAKQFESVFINMMLKTMRTTIPEGQGYIEKSNATKTYESMLDEELSKGMAQGGGFGLSDMIYKSLVKRVAMEEASQNTSIKNEGTKETNKKEKDTSEKI